MPAGTGPLCFAATAEPNWEVPVATIGGLPIAVIDRARSAQLMVDAALARRDGAQRPLVFTSANGQVLSMCARDARLRDLFLGADLIHADGMPLVFVSRLFNTMPLPERVATTDLFHDVARVAQRRGASFIPISISPATAAAICAAPATKSASSTISIAPGRISSGSASARRPNNCSRRAIATGCMASG
jgi:hypothetical protein